MHASIKLADQYEPEMIANRRYLHQHPELSNREFETEKYLVSHLKAMGYEVQSGIAHTGVVRYCARQARAGCRAALRHGRAAGGPS